ncbi:hypothetical protein, partial [Pseudarthrobacter albicanus]|uniref:hypothetical protein n=1 Tax=Pseudarthrobacter albicanus TaxID=2823873 RepID=UPI001BA4DBE2
THSGTPPAARPAIRHARNQKPRPAPKSIRTNRGSVDQGLDAPKIGPVELAAMVKKKLGPRKLTPGLPPEVDRLLDRMQVSGKKRKAQKKSIRGIAYDLHQAMTKDDSGRAPGGSRRTGVRVPRLPSRGRAHLP